MATEFSDIYIDELNTEELHADGGQIVEAWLDGECIWRRVEKLVYWRQVIKWTKYDGKYYGFGLYATKENPIYSKGEFISVYLHGDDTQNMKFRKYINNYNIRDNEYPLSAYHFGMCIWRRIDFGGSKIQVSALGTYDVSKFPENLSKVNHFLGEEFENISDPLGVQCNVLSRRYHIYGLDTEVVIEDVINNNSAHIILPTRTDDYWSATNCAYIDGKIFFAASRAKSSVSAVKSIPLYYISKSNLSKIDYLEIDFPDSWEYFSGYVRLSGMDADCHKMIWGAKIIRRYPDEEKYILYKCDRGTVSQFEIQDAQCNYYGIKLIGKYIVMIGSVDAGEYIYSKNVRQYEIHVGTTIYNMRKFSECIQTNWDYPQPRIFYEESGELFYETIYTQEGYISGWPTEQKVGNSVVIKRKFNFSTGEVETVSETEINGVLEE